MEFITKIEIPRSAFTLSHQDKLIMFGSCFAENIGELLLQNKFDVNLNPFGILYNPSSISESINRILDKKLFTNEDIFEYRGLYQSFSHHGRFSDVDKDKCLEKINASLQTAITGIFEADFLFITFGTSYVYELKENSKIVGNCHKLPSSSFSRYRLSIDTIVRDWTILIERLKENNPTLKIIITVSPIRHLKDGAHENQLSKSILLLAVDRLCGRFDNVFYFPSYEIVLDELRDYRFYGEDMIHPNNLAIKYIWNKFSETFFSKETHLIIKEWNKISAAINHRPINQNTQDYKHFLNQTILKLDTFKTKYPYICCSAEYNELESRLQNSDEIFDSRNS